MPISLRPKCRLAGLAALAAASATFAADWPKFLGPNGDSTSTEKIVDSFPAKPAPLWSAHVGAGYSTPVTRDGKVYVFAMAGNKDTLYCFNAADGKKLWQETGGSAWTKGGMGYPGTRATPTIEGDFIYTYSGKTDLICRNLADGKLVWSVNVIKEVGGKDIEWGASSSPQVVGEMIYVQAGQGGPFAVAVNKKTGKIEWKSENGQAGYATPLQIDVGGEKQLIVVGGKQLYALNPKTGAKIWSQPWETSYDVNAAMPIYREGKLLVSSGYGHGAALFDVSPAGVKKVWEKKILQAKFPSPILDGDVVFGNSEGTLTCIDWNTGAKLWDGPEKIGAGGSMIRAGDKLVVLSERGKLSLLKASRQGVEKVSQFAAVDGTNVWSAPIISDGRLFLKGSEDLVCFDVAAK